MTKLTILRLPDETAEKIQQVVERTGIPFATVCKGIIIERLKTGALVAISVQGEE
jgi:predicted DNA-binding protein